MAGHVPGIDGRSTGAPSFAQTPNRPARTYSDTAAQHASRSHVTHLAAHARVVRWARATRHWDTELTLPFAS